MDISVSAFECEISTALCKHCLFAPPKKICSSNCCCTGLVLLQNPSRLLDLSDVTVFLIREFFPRLESCYICLRVFLLTSLSSLAISASSFLSSI